MMIALFRKELRHVLPWVLLILGIEVLGNLLVAVRYAPDTIVWARWTPMFRGERAFSCSLVLTVWAMLLAFQVFPYEKDEQTIDFLYSLPLRRRSIFLAKYGTAAAILLTAIVAEEATRWFISGANPHPLTGQTFRFSWAAIDTTLCALLALFVLGYAAFLALFQRLGVLIALLAFSTGYMLFERFPAYRLVSPLNLLPLEFLGQRPIWPVRALIGHTVASTACAAVAAYFWTGSAENVMARWGGATRRPRGKVLVRIVSVAVGTAAIVILAFAVSRKNPTKTNANPLDTPPDTMATQHYRFTYPRPFRLRVQRLAAQADALCERGAAALKADCPAKISVDLTRASDTHAGSAALGTIRIDLTAHLDEATLERTLAHETVHTLVAAQTRGRALDAGALRFFDEGLAEFVALKLLPDEATARARVFRTVLARQRLNIGLDVITDYERLRRTADQDLVYDFGLTWLNALVVTCGQGAPAAVVLALSRTDKNGLDGTAFWRDTLRKAGCGWDAVAAQWNLMQDAELGRLKGELDRVPDLVGSVARRDADSVEVVGRLEGTPPPDAAYRLRLRDNDSEPESRYRTFVGEVTSDGAVHFEIQRYEISGERFQFQLGLQWSSLGTTLTHFERWQDG